MAEVKSLSDNEVVLIQKSWKRAVQKKNAIAEEFYEQLFKTRPEFKKLFNGNMESLKSTLMTMFARIAENVHGLDAIIPAIHDIGYRHAGYGVKSDYFGPFCDAFITSMSVGLGDEFNSDIEAAWRHMYGIVSKEMVRAVKAANEGTQIDEDDDGKKAEAKKRMGADSKENCVIL